MAINPKYQKSIWRSAQCYRALNKCDEAIEWCDRVLQLDAKNRLALDLRKECQAIKAQKSRDERKQQTKDKRKADSLRQTIVEIERQGIRFEEHRLASGTATDVVPELLKPCLAPLEDYPVHLDENGQLVWPTAFCYPEFLFSDFQQNLSESVVFVFYSQHFFLNLIVLIFRMSDVLEDMFTEPLDCDKQNRYKPNALSVYFENRIAGTVHKVDISLTIRNIIMNQL